MVCHARHMHSKSPSACSPPRLKTSPVEQLMKTSAAILTEPRGPVTVASIPVAEPGAGEVLVKMEACGLCHSDLFVSSLEKLPLLPLTLGHEGIARIEALGAGVAGWEIGDRAGIT